MDVRIPYGQKVHPTRRKEAVRRGFGEQLDGWYRLSSSGLNRRDLDAFDRWFEVELSLGGWSISATIRVS
jgi:hypothetical protein